MSSKLSLLSLGFWTLDKLTLGLFFSSPKIILFLLLGALTVSSVLIPPSGVVSPSLSKSSGSCLSASSNSIASCADSAVSFVIFSAAWESSLTCFFKIFFSSSVSVALVNLPNVFVGPLGAGGVVGGLGLDGGIISPNLNVGCINAPSVLWFAKMLVYRILLFTKNSLYL